MTRLVRFALCSLENDRANPKSASFRLPSLSIRRFEPAIKHNTLNMSNRFDKIYNQNLYMYLRKTGRRTPLISR